MDTMSVYLLTRKQEQAGSSARAVGSNNVNKHSSRSRSHCILCIMVKAKNLISGECTKSKLWLAKTNVHINRSLLQDSLGGDSKTLILFVQITPSDQDLSQTLTSLNFAGEIQMLKLMLDKARQESRIKDENLKKLEEKLHSLESKTKGKDQMDRILKQQEDYRS